MSTASLIMLPGWGLDSQIWSPIKEELAAQHHLYFVDWHDIHTIADFKERVIHLLKWEKLESYFLLGSSLGSVVALEIAHTYPKQVKGVVMLGGTSRFTVDPSGDYDYGWRARIVERMKSNVKQEMKKTLTSFYTSMFSKSELEAGELARFLSLGVNRNREDNLDSLVIGLDYLIQMDLRKELKNISSPILLIHGEEDKVCPRTAVEYIFYQTKGNADLKILPNTGHLPFFTRPQECLGWIQKFIMTSFENCAKK